MTTKLSQLDSTSQNAGLKAFMQPVLDWYGETGSYSAVAALITAVHLPRQEVNPLAYGAVGGNPAADTAAFRLAIADCVTKGHTLVISRPPSGEWYNINADVWGEWPITGGMTELRWPCLLYVQQTLVQEHRIHGVSRKNGTASGGSMFYASSSFAVGASLRDRAMWRMGDTYGEIFTAGQFFRVQFFGNNVPGLIGVYGDGLQENAGLVECRFQGFRQCASFPYAPSVPAENPGRNANFHLLFNEFNNVSPTETTTDGTMSGGDTVVPLASTTGLYAGDYLGVMTSGGWHIGVVESVADGVSATIYPGIGAAVTVSADAEVQHAAVCLDVWGGSATLVQRNTAVHFAPSRPVAPCVRVAGEHVVVRSLHGESSWCVIELGGWIANNDVAGGAEESSGCVVEDITGNDVYEVGDMAVVRITDRESLSAGSRAYVRSTRIQNLLNKNGCDYLLVDGGGASTGREALTFSTATYGSNMMEPYIIGALYAGAAFGPRTLTQFQEGRRTVAFDNGNIDAFDPTYAKYFRVSTVGSSTGTTHLRSIIGQRFGRELVFTNTNASHTFVVIHNSSSDSAQYRLWNTTQANLLIGPYETMRVTYAVGPFLERWLVEKL